MGTYICTIQNGNINKRFKESFSALLGSNKGIILLVIPHSGEELRSLEPQGLGLETEDCSSFPPTNRSPRAKKKKNIHKVEKIPVHHIFHAGYVIGVKDTHYSCIFTTARLTEVGSSVVSGQVCAHRAGVHEEGSFPAQLLHRKLQHAGLGDGAVVDVQRPLWTRRWNRTAQAVTQAVGEFKPLVVKDPLH